METMPGGGLEIESSSLSPELSQAKERQAVIDQFEDRKGQLRQRLREDLYANATADPYLSIVKSQTLLNSNEQEDFHRDLISKLDSPGRIDVAKRIWFLGMPQVVAQLLTDTDPSVRSAMARNCWDTSVLREHAHLLATDSDPNVRAAVASNFFFVFNHPSLAKSMITDKSPLVRAEIARNEVTALHFPKLIRSLFKDEDAGVRAGVAENKWAAALYPDLTKRLFEDSDSKVRAALAGNEVAAARFPKLVAKLFKDRSENVRLAALNSHLSDKFPELAASLNQDKSG